MDVQAVEAAMCRLASQHHLSDYNKMKRGVLQPMPPPLAIGKAPVSRVPVPPIPQQHAKYNGAGKIARVPASATPVAVSNKVSKEAEVAAQALLRMTSAHQEHSSKPHLHRKTSEIVHGTGPLDGSPPTSLESSAPQLHRTYTEEEGENPHLQASYTAVSPQKRSASGSSLSQSSGLAPSPALTAVALSTPALSMASVGSSSSLRDLTFNEDVEGNSILRRDSLGPVTPPDSLDRPHSYTAAELRDLTASNNDSPLLPKSDNEHRVERELSDRLLDAMEDNTAIPSSPRGKALSPNSLQNLSPAQRALQGLGIIRPTPTQPASLAMSTRTSTSSSSASASSSMSSSMSRSVSSAPPAGAGRYDYSHPSLAGVKTSLTHPMNVSPIIPVELLPLYGQKILMADPAPADSNLSRSPLGKSRLANINPPPRSHSRPASPDKANTKPSIIQQNKLDKPFVIKPSADLHLLTGPNASQALFNLTLPVSHSLANKSTSDTVSPVKLGNLVLSSCPGKKVRLSEVHLQHLGLPETCKPGPANDPRSGNTVCQNAILQSVNARSPICRDIELDFRRAMELSDIRVVVCCLDNEEMNFLGAPWEEYQRVAKDLGIEVIRLPMAEGFAPASPEQLDAHLSYLIRKYTLRGHSALVHCRGGVGRAGLFACSWMIKLGLLGSVKNIHDPAGQSVEGEMRITEMVIEIIRKRRSAKAIETPLQVHFILQYVNWLSTLANEVSAAEILGV